MKPKPTPPVKNPGYLLEHLTHRPFADLKDQLKAQRKQSKKNDK